MGGLLNGSPARSNLRTQNNELRSVNGLSALEIKEDAKSESIKDIAVSNVNINITDNRGSAQAYDPKMKRVTFFISRNL